MFSVLDLVFVYLRYFPAIFGKLSADIPNSTTSSLKIHQSPSGNISLGQKVAFTCGFYHTDCEPWYTSGDIVFKWDLHLGNTSKRETEFQISENGSLGRAGYGQLEIVFNKTDAADVILCKAISSDSNDIVAEAQYSISFLDINGKTNNRSTTSASLYPTPTNLTAGYIEGRSAVISWNPPSPQDVTEIVEYIIEYKITKSSWASAKVMKISGSQCSAHVEYLSPWTMYHFRISAVYQNGKSDPSYPIVVLTPEEAPSGAPQNVKVEIVDDHTLEISWKPAPRNTWNGALLGYNIGSRKASSMPEETYTFHVLTAMELLGKPCLHQISVPDSSIPYIVVVQAFNNVGPGPISEEASSTYGHKKDATTAN